MSKFLEIIENNNPEIDLDSITSAKRELQRMLIKQGVIAKAGITDNMITIVLPDKRVMHLEVKNVETAGEEEAEDPLSSTISSIAAIAGMPDQQGLGRFFKGTTAGKFALAKRKMADAAVKIADKFEKSV